MRIINWNLAKHPVNWLVILSMLLIAGYAAHLILKAARPHLTGGAAPAVVTPDPASATQSAA